MLPLLSVLTLAKKAYKFRESRKNGGEGEYKESKPKKPMSAKGKLRLFVALPVIITAIAFLLSILCIYAGSKPGMMEDYAVFTLNTSRLGENVLQDIDGKIKSIDLKFKRDEPMEPATAPVAMITPAPTTLVTMAPRDIVSDIESLTSKAGFKASSVKTDVASKASSVKSEASAKAKAAIDSSKNKIIEIINKAFRGAIEGLDLQDFYNVHISASCVGTYAYKDGKNYTAGDSKNLDELKSRVDSCEGHSAVNPFQLVRIIYWIAFVLTAVTLVLGLVGIVKPTKKVAMINIFGTLPALTLMGLASAVTHGIAVGAAHLITFVGEKVGITGISGHKFIQLTWATTIILLVNLCLWAIIFFLIGRMEKKAGGKISTWGRTRADRTSTIAMEQYPDVSRPLPVHTDRHGHAMI